MNKFLKDLMTLATELNEAKGFNTLVVINEMELLYDKHVIELEKLHIASILSLPTDAEIDNIFPINTPNMPQKGISYNGGKRFGAKWMKQKVEFGQ